MALTAGDGAKALEHFRKATEIADGAFVAGFLAATQGNTAEAEAHLAKAAQNKGDLGRQVSKSGIDAAIRYPITPEIAASICIDRVGRMLLAAELYQKDGRPDKALKCVAKTVSRFPDDPVLRLSLAELLVETAESGDGCCRNAAAAVRGLASKPTRADNGSAFAVSQLVDELEGGSERIYRRVVELTQATADLSPLHGCLLVYGARALSGLGLPKAARQTSTNTLRRRKGRPEEFLRAQPCERAVAYAETGQRARSRGAFETLYALQPGYEDVAAWICLGQRR